MQSMLDSGVTANFESQIPLMFENMKWMIKEVSPFLMIAAAITVAAFVLGMIIDMFIPKTKDDDDVEYM